MSDPFPSAAFPIVQIEKLTRRFDTKLAIDDLSLTIPHHVSVQPRPLISGTNGK